MPKNTKGIEVRTAAEQTRTQSHANAALECILLLFTAPSCRKRLEITQYSQGDKKNEIPPHHAARFRAGLALQLLFLPASESMGNHDSNVVGAGRVG